MTTQGEMILAADDLVSYTAKDSLDPMFYMRRLMPPQDNVFTDLNIGCCSLNLFSERLRSFINRTGGWPTACLVVQLSESERSFASNQSDYAKMVTLAFNSARWSSMGEIKLDIRSDDRRIWLEQVSC